MIFSRGRGRGGRGKRASEELDQQNESERAAEQSEEDRRGGAFGPYDVSEAPEDGLPRIDLGALRLPAINGLEVRMHATPEGAVQQIVLVDGEGSLSLGAFAAPRSEGIWAELRVELSQSLTADRADPHETTGEYGVELRARVPTPDGPLPIRFVGVDGPRWFVQGVFQGAAADPGYAGPLREALRALVVDRGEQAMPVREPLPLKLPPEATGAG